MIGDDVEVVVLGVEGDFVKLGFNAPKEVQIMRQELHQVIAEQNAGAIHVDKIQLDQLLKNFKN
ncbi:carbon storage regulator [Paenibacillus aquistagni]|uniref:Carbon storage regulator, CsrA n=1 Tax=Paenibacillus aquistagni TaxID=1852522 RepID=A0A1X7KXT9_9BACL|nr:carbon storage regulator, CsrA [Paenibacillus aquistagni]